jgi:hypothetical protein
MSSVQQVDQVVRLAKELKRPVATSEQARELSKLGVWYNSVEETLAALVLPPNRKDGQLGFIVTETDGKPRKATVGSDGHALAGELAAQNRNEKLVET